MIPVDKTSYIRGNFKGRYHGALILEQPIDNNQKSYNVDIHPNSEVSNVEFVEDYHTLTKNSESVRIPNLDEVNVLFDKSKLTHAVDSKEKIHHVIITDFKIVESGKDSNKTHGILTGTFFGTLYPNNSVPVENDFSVVNNPVTPSNPTLTSNSYSNKFSSWYSNLFGFGSWKLGGCLFRLLQLLGLVFLLSLLLRWCNNFHLPMPLPRTTLDSLSQDNKETMLLENQSATITVNDWNRPDNDRITLKVNDLVIAKNMLITKTPKTLEINNLHKGKNSLVIIPTSFGLGAVTATVEIGDQKNTFRFKCTIHKGEVVRKNLLVK